MACDPLVSVIIPSYNVDETMFRICIDSLLNQTFWDFELLIVNDGSKSEFNSLYDWVGRLDNRIFVLHKENGGVSSARNYGLTAARGKYIAFVDADDFVGKQYLEQAISICEEYECDYVIGAIRILPEAADIKEAYHRCNSDNGRNIETYKVYQGDEILDLAPHLIASNKIIGFADGGHINRGPVARLLKREIAKEIDFPLGIVLGEDVIWNQNVINNCNNIVVVKNVWYYYVTNENSAVNRYKEDAIDLVIDQIHELSKVVDLDISEIYVSYIERIFTETRGEICICYLTNRKNKNSFFVKWREFNSLKKMFPWNQIGKKYYKLAQAKGKLNYIMFKTNTYFLAAFIRDRLFK